MIKYLKSILGHSSIHFYPVRETTYSFQLSCNQFLCTGNLQINGPELFQISFSEPETLSFLQIQSDRHLFIIKFGDHSDSLLDQVFPDNAPIILLIRALEKLLYETHEFCSDGNEYISAQAEVSDYPIEAFFYADGFLRSISCSVLNLSVIFDHGT